MVKALSGKLSCMQTGLVTSCKISLGNKTISVRDFKERTCSSRCRFFPFRVDSFLKGCRCSGCAKFSLKPTLYDLLTPVMDHK